MKSWLAAYVRLYHEKKTRDRLTAMGIESFLPVQEEIHQWSDRRKKIERVVIPMMIFVHVDPAERAEVLTLSSVSRYMVLRGQSTPAVIPDEQMERFRFMLDYSEEAIEVCSSPLAGLEGELVTIDGKSKVAVRLDMLGCAHVDMPVGFVERVGKMEAVR
ncbi:UpxY family transcription antiterminator [Bacteroides fragilis]